MIRHIVFFSVKEGQDIETVKKGLEQLGTIPHADLFEVLPNSRVDPMCDRIDLVVYAEFKDEEALFAFKKHPTYDATTQLVRPMRELRFSADVLTDKR
ncbi:MULTISPECIES: Dabb family protein [Brucella]|uniref:Dabb family protein n=1 Tax=Brucella anthropi TaxID=529 RepID=A0A011TTJ5_BRUAN|nr:MULTISPECIES: Dabb family protein [Brucella/Ochrobactrum group]MCR5940289.1 Dabb family protein [Ochrobactrum sp. XJ1]QTN01836.1 Dabb family protein [Ochrobactrum sp. EEELCW01]AIK44089.1 stress responsive A/B Barrel domain protein [Brucella anthropi]EXL07447.1 stress responsive protein [Brucella anthropi]KAB2741043.1 Dabb family protein [Brucella anthropi]